MRLNKFACILLALLLVLLAGCSGKAAEVKQADFSFNLPEGYSLSDVTDESCNIVSDEGDAIIGGITVTSLKPKLLSNENSTTEIMTYLQNEFHKTNNVEFIAFYSGSGSPFVSINLTKNADDTGEKSHFQHIFFEKDGIVYHLWLDMDVVDPEAADEISAFVRGAKAQLTASDTAAEPQRRLWLAVTKREKAYTEFSLEDMGGGELIYEDVADVKILLDGEKIPLDEAIQNGMVSVPELVAWARTDAENGLCQESSETANGLTEFLYHYTGYNLSTIYDILDAPDGSQHLIQQLSIQSPFSSCSVKNTIFLDDDGNILDREDWGITLEVQDVTPTGMTLKFTQSGGQQLGQLQTRYYILTSIDENKVPASGENVMEIAENDDTLYTLDWSDTCGALPSGTYQISIEVRDVYDESQIHPLIRKFHNTQYYGLDFEIP